MNIIDLVLDDGVRLTKHGATYRGRCPFHNGKTETSLLVDADAGRYHCFGCGAHGDSIQWLRDRRGLSFIDACKFLEHDPGPRLNKPRLTDPKWEAREAKTPADAWQAKARAFLDNAIASLWSEPGDSMRTWLHTQKGLSDTSIKAAKLGYNQAEIYELRSIWNLGDVPERRVWLPAGLVIPLIIGGRVQRLRIRRQDPREGPRYVIIPGSSSASMVLGKDKCAIVIVESELDGLLLSQEAGDLLGVVALGSAQAKPDRITHEALTATEDILVGLDSDDAGAKAAWAFWPEIYGARVKRWPVVIGKDPSEAWANGLDLRACVVAGIFGTEERAERFAIQTIDGGMGDTEAIRAMQE